MKSVKEVLDLSCQYLTDRKVPNARRCVEELLADILHVDRVRLYMDFDHPLEGDELQRCRQGVSRLAQREPWQYVIGYVDFYGCRIKVNKEVLIPRQETEILADIIAKKLEARHVEGCMLWDVCCGSGCLGIALKKRFPTLQVIVSDISTKALEIAKDNAQYNNVEVSLLQGDLLAPFSGNQADFIVCNPPYVSEKEYQSLDPEVVHYEPRQALVGGPTGLEMYRHLAKNLGSFLNPEALVWLELGTGQGNSVGTLFSEAGWQRWHIEKDWAGHDRFFFLEI